MVQNNKNYRVVSKVVKLISLQSSINPVLISRKSNLIMQIAKNKGIPFIDIPLSCNLVSDFEGLLNVG